MQEIATGERNKQIQEISSRKVAEHNDLISSVAKMDKTPLKIFELAVSCIDTDAPPKDNTVFLSKKELFTFFDVSDNDKHRRFKEAVEKMFNGTKVKSVNTMNLDGKTKRRGMTYGKTAKTKKAIVQLTEDSADIEIFEGL